MLDAEPAAPQPEIVQHDGEVLRRRSLGLVCPDADICDRRRVTRLPKVGRAGQQRGAAIGADIEALEEAEAERVVARQPIHAVLREEQQAVEVPCGEFLLEARHAALHLAGLEMQGHGGSGTIVRLSTASPAEMPPAVDRRAAPLARLPSAPTDPHRRTGPLSLFAKVLPTDLMLSRPEGPCRSTQGRSRCHILRHDRVPRPA